MSHTYAGVLLGVLLTEEQDKLLHGGKGTDGLLNKYGQSLQQDEREGRYVIPAYAQHAGPDYLGFYLFTGGEKLVEHYVMAGMAFVGEPVVKRLPDSSMDGLHFAGLLVDALAQWLSFTEFCRKHGVEFTIPKLYLIIDRE